MRIAVSGIKIGVLENIHIANSRMHPETKSSVQAIDFIYDDEIIINRTISAKYHFGDRKIIQKRAVAFLNLRKSEILLCLKEKEDARKSLVRALQMDPVIIIKERFRDLISIILKIIFSDDVLEYGRKN